ncbi:MAG: B12-binding domain-containing radical SAM protein [Armatimonadetes bacterium]|nr:B12-binding domain-containing radical SAM protein [Armatimonadota bacterium]
MRIVIADLPLAHKDPDRFFVYPFGAAYVASYAKRRFPEHKIYIERDPAGVAERSPDLLGISSLTENYPLARELASQWAGRIPVIVGGHHITAVPHDLPEGALAGVIGEGEEAFTDLIQACAAGKTDPRDLREIPGIVCREKGAPQLTPSRTLIKDLDSLPFPLRDLGSRSSGFSFTSRGCPFRCRFCASTELWRSYRTHSPEYVQKEIRMLVERHDTRYIYFLDDLFAAKKARLARIRDLLVSSGLRDSLSFCGSVRADVWDEDLGRILSEMNFRAIFFGAESGSDRVLSLMKKGTTVAQNQRVLDDCKRLGIQVEASFVIGFPGEKAGDLEMTLEFIEKNRNRLGRIGVTPLVAFPKTPVWEEAIRSGKISRFPPWETFRLQEIDVFDPKDYLFLNDGMSFDTFLHYVDRLRSLHLELNSPERDR